MITKINKNRVSRKKWGVFSSGLCKLSMAILFLLLPFLISAKGPVDIEEVRRQRRGNVPEALKEKIKKKSESLLFKSRFVTPQSVVGYHRIPFFDDFYQVNRNILVWYPVEASIEGTSSENYWDVFKVAIDAPPAVSKMKKPVVIISHGYTGNPHQLSWLIRGLVYHGFIVVGIQHKDLIDGKVHINHWQRAQDMKIVIDQFSLDSISEFANLNKIGIAGFSLGGTTAIWTIGGRSTKLDSLIPGPEYAASNEYSLIDEALPTLNKEMMSKDWHDARVKAAFIMAPAWAWLFDEKSLKKVSIPTYLIASSADQVLVTKTNAGFFARNIPKSIFREISGEAGHYIFISALNEGQRKKADPSGQLNFLFEDDVSVDRNWMQFQIAEEVAKFFNFAFRLIPPVPYRGS